MNRFCSCKRCKRLRKRDGVVLGTRVMGYFSQGVFDFGYVSDYVRHPKFAKGRVRKERNKESMNDQIY